MDTILCYLYLRIDGYNSMLSILENRWIQFYAMNLSMRIDGYNSML